MALVNSVDPVAATPALAATLARHLGGVSDVEVTDVFVPASAGLSAETVMFTAGWTAASGERESGDYVARVGPQGPGLFYSYDLELEARVMAAVGSAGVPVPPVLLYEGDPSVLGAAFLVMPRIAGRTLSDDPPFTAAGWLVESSPEEQRRALDNALDAMAAVHRLDPVAIGLGDLGRYAAPGEDLLGAHIAHWEKAFAWASEGRANP